MTIKDAISNTTLVTGDDPSLVYQALEHLVSDVQELCGGDLEKVTFQGGESSVNDVVTCWSQNFIFSSRALVILRDPSNLTSEDAELLVGAMEQIKTENYLVLANFSGKIDKKLQAYFTKRKAVVNAALGNRKDKTDYLGDVVVKSGLQFKAGAYRQFVQSLGEDVGRAEPILEMLKASLGDEAEVTSDLLSPYLGSPGDAKPWDITDAIEAGDVVKATEVLRRMMDAGGRHPLVILAILQRRFSELGLVCSDGIRTPSQATDILRARDKNFRSPEWSVKKLMDTSKRLGNTKLTKSFVLMSKADRQIKGEGGLTPEIAIELLVARLAQTMKVR